VSAIIGRAETAALECFESSVDFSAVCNARDVDVLAPPATEVGRESEVSSKLWESCPVEVGDLLLRAKDSGLGWHYATGISGGLVKDNTPEAGKHLTTFEGFCAGKQGFIIRYPRSDHENALVEERTLSNVGDRYDAAMDNCEHDANFSQTGVASSPSATAILVVGALGLVAGIAHILSDK
jgi:hypothetical protein